MLVMVQSVVLFLFLPSTKTVIFFFFLINLSLHICPLIKFIIIFYSSDYTSLQLFLSCGQKVTIYSKPVGYSDNRPPASGLPVSNDFSVNSWTNDLEDDFSEAQVKQSK